MKNSILNLLRKTVCSTLLVAGTFAAKAQCPSGYNKFTLKWDYLDYIVYTGNYPFSNGYYTSLPYVQNQYFSFGSQRLNIACTYGKNNIIGENTTHKGETGSYGNGKPGVTGPDIDADVQYLGNGQIVLTFDTEVQNLQFSLFDVDNKQVIDLTAVNAAATPVPIQVTTLGVTQLTVTNNNTPAVNVASNLVGGLPQYSNTFSVNASFNVDIAGPVKQVTLIASNSGNDGTDNGSYWLSDITACTPGTFPTNYYAISKPFTGQPSYILHSLGNTVYMLDPATGKTKPLFTDPAATTINSMAYDPYNKILYYVNDDGLTNSTGRALKKYDCTTETISVACADLVALGIALSTFEGVNNGGACFYNGSLYLGVQTANLSYNSGREALIWRIDFDASNNPYRVSQTYGQPCDDGAGLVNGFGDFVIRDGVLFQSDNATDEPDYYHIDMKTGIGVAFPINPLPDDQPGEVAMDWTGKIYQLLADNMNGISPYMAVYNEDGTIGAKTPLVSSPMYTPAIPILGDAADAFRPKSDFGDAPPSYDPVGLEPATHEKDANLRLGSGFGHEWVKTAVIDGDTFDDGLGAAPSLNYFGTTTYTINVNVYNNTGANATLACWLDWNFNGIYEAGEGRTVTVPTGASMQIVPVSWNMWVGYTASTNTWLRLRLTSASNGMTVNNMTGYYSNGEVEDYSVAMGTLLAKNVLAFTAKTNNHMTADLNWQLNTAPNFIQTVVQRSKNGLIWDSVGVIPGTKEAVSMYNMTDNYPLSGISYYRLKLVFTDGTVAYSDVRNISLADRTNCFQLYPNPVDQFANIKITSSITTIATIDMIDNNGRVVLTKHIPVTIGDNNIRLDEISRFASGVYNLSVSTTEFNAIERLVIRRN
ncbi:MAG: T9SS type A sorting domain-containing protein [Bacteroidetes bacterium]|nr:T9SS type A sorting domain-containing protein [Bacteroidota bacterium]